MTDKFKADNDRPDPAAAAAATVSADSGGREAAVMSVGGAAVWAMASQYAGFVIHFGTSVIISRFFLAPAEVGLFSIALAAAMLVAVLQDFGLSRYISGLPRLDAEEINRCSSVALVFSMGVAALIMLAAWPLALLYGLPDLAPLLVIIGASYIFLPLAVVPLALMGRAMRFKGHFAVNVGGAAIHASVALALAAAGLSAYALAWATLASGLARGLIAQALQRAMPFPLRIDGLRPIVNFGGKASALYMTGALGTRTPDLILGKLVSLAAVGLYSRASSLAEHFRMLIAGAIGGVFYPAFARIRDRGEPMGPAYLRVCAGYSALVWPGMAGLALAAEPIVLLLYGREWIGTAPLLTLIAIHSGLMIALPLVTELPILMGKINRLIALNVVETIISVSLLVVGSMLAGVWGAAASRLVFVFIFWAMYLGFMRDVIGFRIRDWVMINVKSAGVSLAAVTPLLLTYAFWQPAATIQFLPLVASTIAGGVLWLGAMFAVKHPALTDLRSVAAPMLQRFSPALGALITPRPQTRASLGE